MKSMKKEKTVDSKMIGGIGKMTIPKYVQTRRDRIKAINVQLKEITEKLDKKDMAHAIRLKKIEEKHELDCKPLNEEFTRLEHQIYRISDDILKWAKTHRHEHEWKQRYYKQDHYVEGTINQCTMCEEKTGFID